MRGKRAKQLRRVVGIDLGRGGWREGAIVEFEAQSTVKGKYGLPDTHPTYRRTSPQNDDRLIYRRLKALIHKRTS